MDDGLTILPQQAASLDDGATLKFDAGGHIASFGSAQSPLSPDASPGWAPQLGQGPETGGIFAQLGDESRLAAGLPVYRKVRLLGRGAFGKAYLVEGLKRKDPSPGGPSQKYRRVLKKLPLKGIEEAQREAAFREALVMRKISRGCPFITQFSEVFLAKGGLTLCLVMEYCSGGDLRTMLRGQQGTHFEEANVLNWGSQIGLALRHCHVHFVLHRDVKPENCFFRSAGGDLLLGDFGISCSLDEKSFVKTCVGSPLYLSPEIINQEPYSYATDAWSWGVMIYELATLNAPFKGTNICQVAFKIVSAIPEPIDPTLYSQELRAVVEKLMEKEVPARYSVEEALLASPMAPWAEYNCNRSGIPWPLPAPSLSTRSGVVEKLRAQFAGTSEEPHGEYEDDFEPCDDEEEEADYADDFEAASGGSCSSYEQDFETLSDDDEVHDGLAHHHHHYQNSISTSPGDSWHGLPEEDVRLQLHHDLGADGLAMAETLGVASFLERVRDSVNGVGRPQHKS